VSSYEEFADMARDLIGEAKGSEGPKDGFVTDHLDAAEGWIDKMEVMYRDLQAANTALMTERANLITTKHEQLDALTAERDMWRAQALRGAQ
jgi:hypothetical protein